MFCKYCGKEVDQNATICANCGGEVTPLASDGTIPTNKAVPQQPVQPQQGQYIPPYPQQYQHIIDPNEPASVGIIIVCVLIPIIGIIMGCVYMSDGRKRAGKAYLTASLITIGVGILISIITFIVFASLINSAAHYWYW